MDSSDPVYPRPVFPPKCPAVATADSCFWGRTNLSCQGELCKGADGFGGLYSLKPMTLHSLLWADLGGVWKNADRLQIRGQKPEATAVRMFTTKLLSTSELESSLTSPKKSPHNNFLMLAVQTTMFGSIKEE